MGPTLDAFLFPFARSPCHLALSVLTRPVCIGGRAPVSKEAHLRGDGSTCTCTCTRAGQSAELGEPARAGNTILHSGSGRPHTPLKCRRTAQRRAKRTFGPGGGRMHITVAMRDVHCKLAQSPSRMTLRTTQSLPDLAPIGDRGGRFAERPTELRGTPRQGQDEEGSAPRRSRSRSARRGKNGGTVFAYAQATVYVTNVRGQQHGNPLLSPLVKRPIEILHTMTWSVHHVGRFWVPVIMWNYHYT